MFELHNVGKEYRSRRGSVRALHDLTLRIEPGSFLAVTGPSGSGKTTLLLMLGGLIRPTSGRVVHRGVDLYSGSAARLAGYRNREVGFVLQTFHLVPYLTAMENVAIPMLFSDKPSRDHAARARCLLERLGLTERLDHLPRELSVGEQQRVAIARALANDPPVILADEPTGNLDPALAHEILGILQDLSQREQRTVVMVTHSPDAAVVGTHRLSLCRGRAEPIPERLAASGQTGLQAEACR